MKFSAEPETQDDAAIKREVKRILDEAFEEMQNQPRRGGLILPTTPGCSHDWQPWVIRVNTFGHDGTIAVRRCSKCHVLGDFP